MTTAQVVETSVTVTNTRKTTDAPGFKTFTKILFSFTQIRASLHVIYHSLLHYSVLGAILTDKRTDGEYILNNNKAGR